MNDFYIILAASPVLLLGAVTFVVFIAVGIRRGDRGNRLTGKPGSALESLARRVLTGSRGFNDESED